MSNPATTTTTSTTPDCGPLHIQPEKWHYRTVDGIRRYQCPKCTKFMGYGEIDEIDKSGLIRERKR